MTITDRNFDQKVLKSESPVLVDFWASWCMPCRILFPIIDELTIEYEGKVKIGKLNVDENPKVASKYGIMSIPSLLIFKKGQPVKSIVGVQSKGNIKKEIDSILASS